MNNLKLMSAGVLLMSIFALGIAQRSEVRTTGSFDEISTTGGILVELVPGDKEEVKVRVSEVDLDKVVTEVSNGVLKIRMKPGIYKNATINVTVSYQTLRELRATAGGEYYSRSVLSGDKLSISAIAGGIATLEVDVNAVELKAGEGSRVEISGLARSQRSAASSGGVILAEELESETVSVKANTGGRAEIYVLENLEANVSTGGRLTYFGNPAIETIKSNLGGKIEKR